MEKIITIQVKSTLEVELDYKEFEFPLLNQYLDQDWEIRQIHQNTTNTNVGFIYLTFHLQK